MIAPRRLATLLAIAALAATTSAVGGRSLGRRDMHPASMAREQRFPHAAHDGLFPTCVGCHQGIVSGDTNARFPQARDCTSCHDGVRVSAVVWDGPAPAPSNLRFSHVEHAPRVTADSQRTGGGSANPSLQCRACHAIEGDARFLAVERARPESCLACHAHAAPAHLDARSDCRSCHLPLARATRLSVERIGGFPRPPSHDAPDFRRRHAPADERSLASCATCHAQQSCARCHVNARSERSIAALGSDPRVATLVADRGGHWPVPESHARRDWVYEHGRDATRATASCATCHAQPSCRSCHIGAGAERVIRRLPGPDPGFSPGVQLRGAALMDLSLRDPGAAASGRHLPVVASVGAARGAREWSDTTNSRVVRVHGAGYARTHGTEASAQALDCAGCHVQRFCSDCHAGEGRRRYHPANFVQRHAPEAWGREQDCASCHNPEAFCQSCHASTGLASSGGLRSAYHTRQPGWLLQHGQAARQGLESCTTCHAQRDCMQCHSRAGWNVSPHGRDFDAERMAKRAPGTCATCHVGDPLARRR